MGKRGIAEVPRSILSVLILALFLQIGWQHSRPAPFARAEALAPPYAAATVRVASGGETVAAAQLGALYLQAFDNQPGISIPFAALDYARVIQWLDLLLDLDARSHYPLMMASQLYAQVPDAARQRAMLDFVHRRFLEDPNRRWRWLAHAAIMAKHRLQEPARALRYAADIARHARQAPGWARQMQIFVLEGMGERDAAAILLGGLLASGEVTDPQEIRFLAERLEKFKAAEIPSLPSRN